MRRRCSVCKKDITGKECIVINYNRLGSLRVLESMHITCWERLVKEVRKSIEG